VSRTDAHFEGFARLNEIDPALSEDTPMKEGVAGTIREFDEPKAFLGIEPLDDSTNWRARRCVQGGSVEAGTGAKGTRLHVIGIGVEVATPRMTKILLSHFSSWRWLLINSVGRRLDLSPI
jgi:hypothetical protein